MKSQNLSFVVFLALLAMAGCDNQPRQRTYVELHKEPPAVPMDMQSMKLPPGHPQIDGAMPSDHPPINGSMPEMGMAKSNSNIKWTKPDGWAEQPGDGMRAASFVTPDEDSILCTIISLGGQAGGLEANIDRWTKQIGINNISSGQMQNFLAQAADIVSEGNLSAKIYDFTILQTGGKDDVPSMIAAIFDVQGQTLFVKLTGSRSAVSKEKDRFIKLCRSLSIP